MAFFASNRSGNFRDPSVRGKGALSRFSVDPNPDPVLHSRTNTLGYLARHIMAGPSIMGQIGAIANDIYGGDDRIVPTMRNTPPTLASGYARDTIIGSSAASPLYGGTGSDDLGGGASRASNSGGSPGGARQGERPGQRNHAKGGYVKGPAGKDRVRGQNLTKGEFIVPTRSVKAGGPALMAALKNPKEAAKLAEMMRRRASKRGPVKTIASGR